MPTYSIQGNDGKTYSIEGPEGATEAQVIAAIEAELSGQGSGEEDEIDRIEAKRAALRKEMEAPAKEEEGPKIYEDDPFYEDILKGFGAGFVDTVESAALGGATIAGEETETELRDSIQDVAKGLRPDVDPDSTWGKIAGGLGSAAAFIAPAILAAATLPATAATVVGTGIAGVLGLSAAAGEASERARAADASVEDRVSAAAIYNPYVAAAGAIEILPLGRFVKAIHVPFISDLVNKVGPDVASAASNRVTRALASGGVEAAQEVVSEVLQNLNEKYGYNPDKSVFIDAGLVESGEIGFTTGFILDALSGRRISKSDKKLGTVDNDGGFTPTEQGELFASGEDLGTAPTTKDTSQIPNLEQGELFLDEDLGSKAVEEEQLDLFDTPQAAPTTKDTSQIPNLEGDPTRQTTDETTELEAMLAKDAEVAAQEQARKKQQAAEKATTVPNFTMRGREAAKTSAFGANEEAFKIEKEIRDTVDEESAEEFRKGFFRERKRQEKIQNLPLEEAVKFIDAEADTLKSAEDKVSAGTQFNDLTEAERTVYQREIIDPLSKKQKEERLNTPITEIPMVEAKATLPERLNAPITEDVLEEEQIDAKPTLLPENLASTEVATERGGVGVESGVEVSENVPAAPDTVSTKGAGTTTRAALGGLGGDTVGTTVGESGVDSTLDANPILESAYRKMSMMGGEKKFGALTDEEISELTKVDPYKRTEEQKDIIKKSQAEITLTSAARTESPTPDKKSTRNTTRKGATEDAVTKIEKTLGITKKAVLERVKERTKTATSKVEADKKRRAETKAKATPKETKSVLDKAVESTAKSKTKRGIKNDIKEEVKFYNALSLRSKTKTKLDVYDAKEEAAGRVTLKEARKEANELDFYINEYPDQDTSIDFTQEELKKVQELITQPMSTRKQKYPQEDKTGRAAANLYFIKQVNPKDALDNIAHDIVFSNDQFRSSPDMSPAEKIYFNQTGAKNAILAAKWVRNNLNKSRGTLTNIIKKEAEALKQQLIRYNKLETIDNVQVSRDVDAKKVKAELLETQQRLKDDYKFTSKGAKAVDELTNIDYEEDTSTLSLSDVKDLLLPSSEVLALDSAPHPIIKSLLKQGKLKEALSALGITTKNDRLAQVAKGLSKITGNTKVKVVNFLINDAGVEVAGLFDPKTNTIKLNAETGLNPHVILHEMTHAATSATLANKSHPVTKQLNTLFNDIKDMLGTAYGSTNLDEFVSEAFTNPEFQKRLAGIHYKSEVSGWQRFVNAVSNFIRTKLGMQTKNLDTALNASDVLIKKILYPSFETRNADVLEMNSTPEGVKKIMKHLGDSINKKITPEERKKFGFEAAEFLKSNVTDKAKNLLMRLSGSQGLGEIADSVGFGNLGHKMDKLFLRQRGAMYASDRKVRAVVDKVAEWSKNAGQTKEVALDNVIYNRDYGSTINQVDPTLTETEAQSRYKNDAEKMAIWKKQRPHWDSLGKDGQDIYTLMRDTYKKQYEELRKVIDGEIDNLLAGDPASAKRLKNEVLARLFEKTTLDVYFPLLREGKYKLAYAPFDPTTNKTPDDAYTVLMFHTEGERDAAKRLALADKDIDENSIDTSDGDIKFGSFNNAPPTSFVGATLDILKTANFAKASDKSEIQDAVMRLFVETLPQTSFAKSLQKRKNTLGNSTDSIHALKTKAFDLGRQTEKLRYGAEIRALETEIKDLVEPKDLPESKSFIGVNQKRITASFEQVRNELLLRGKFARMGANDKQAEQYYKLANQIAFIFTIGTNPSSAIVNLSQIPLVVLPYLGAKYGYVEASAQIISASKLVSGSIPSSPDMKNIVLKKFKGFVDFGIDNYYDITDNGDFVLNDAVPESQRAELQELALLVKTAAENGLLGRSEILEAAGIQESARANTGRPLNKLLDKISALSSVFFNSAERYNRQVTLISTYQLALKDIKAKPRFFDSVNSKFVITKDLSPQQKQELAVRESIYQTQQTNGGAVLETTSSIIQQGPGRVAGMYKSFGMNMYYTMMRSAKIAFDSEKDPELRSIARKQLIGVHGSAAFFAGIHGVPVYGLFTMIADLFLGDDEEDADTIVRNYFGEGAYKGVIALTGIDISDRIKLTDLLFQQNRFNSDPSAEEIFGGFIGGPALSIGKRFARGVENIQEGNIERGIENFVPSGISNLYKSTFGRYQREGGIYSKRGDPLYDNMNGFEMIGQALGFAPTGYTYNQELSSIRKGIDKTVNLRKSKLLKQYYMAIRMGDSAEDIVADILKFNKKHPAFAISTSSIKKSMKMHANTSALMHNGVILSKSMRIAIETNMQDLKD
jgi:hypothetical protein